MESELERAKIQEDQAAFEHRVTVRTGMSIDGYLCDIAYVLSTERVMHVMVQHRSSDHTNGHLLASWFAFTSSYI
jgi:hypothetical protein